MSTRLDPSRVHEVAANLCENHSDIDTSSWTDVADERQRSAVSRAYYSAFLALKQRILKAKNWKDADFPEDGAHTKLIRAVRKSLGDRHKIAMKLRSLKSARGDADYIAAAEIDHGFAVDRVDDAHDLLDWIANLSESKIADIANRI